MVATFMAARRMKRKMATRLLKKNGVYGVGIGYRDPANPKKGAAVIIYTDKVSSASLGLVPSMFTAKAKGKGADVPIRIVKTGKIRAHANYTGRIRPVPPGYSVGTTKGSGSAGLIVTNRSKAANRYLLSNNHVLNPNNATRTTETLQPGGADGGRPGTDRIGRLYSYVKLEKNKDNFIDAALSVPTNNRLLNPNYPTVGAIPGYVTSYRVGEQFKKVGRTTGLVNGRVESIDTDIQIDYGGRLGVLNFKNQTVIRGTTPISLAGDSGSVWLRRADNYAAAVNFAGSLDGRLSIAFPVRWAMQAFGTKVALASGASKVKQVTAVKTSRAYVRKLPANVLARIKPKKAVKP
ncbi:S1 family peptidase [Paenibacillus sp. MZ04-78.2]|uniref:S1 family peptidase n=1 Tax=Paenibacillus sp. MZ04-78.2 TaxID=2962034 RepID=UPI0020B7159E|nr:S1 family peptidase [Paenibacillus sp. MZ04-78.2]MCP3776090.1 S1 family peptidase [Paenibacillus sp. MZ04-78.2]